MVAASVAAYFSISKFFARLQLKCFADPLWILLLINCFWLNTYFAVPVTTLLIYVLFCTLFFFYVVRYVRKKYCFVVVSVLIALLFWLLAKVPTFFHMPRLYGGPFSFAALLPWIGVPYIFSRLVAFAIHGYYGKLPANYRLADFLAQMAFFPTFLSGPVTTPQTFDLKFARQKFDLETYLKKFAFPGLQRIGIGILKKYIVAEIISSIALPFIDIDRSSKVRLILGVYAYTAYLYADFSGYTDLAIGLSKILKIEIPENFNYPFWARNPQDFWARWHISFSKWLYEFIFAPVYAFLLKVFNSAGKIWLAGIAIFTTFASSGIWHGEEWRYFSEGIYHATALLIFVIFDGLLKQYQPKLRKRMKDSTYVAFVSRLVTFHYVVVGLIIFSMNMYDIKRVVSHLIGNVL